MRGKARDILILYRITDFSTTGSAGLKLRNFGRKLFIIFQYHYLNIKILKFYENFLKILSFWILFLKILNFLNFVFENF